MTYTDTKLDVPYFSQYADVTDADQKLFSCVITNAYMALSYLGAELPSLDDFIREGIAEGGFGDSGWQHDYVVNVFRRYGQPYGRAERMIDRSVQHLADALKDDRPVLVSVERVFWDQRSFHGVVLTGIREDANGALVGFFYHDPAKRRHAEGKDLFVPLPLFYTSWRRMAILPEANLPMADAA